MEKLKFKYKEMDVLDNDLVKLGNKINEIIEWINKQRNWRGWKMSQNG